MATLTSTLETVHEISDTFRLEARKEIRKVRLVIENFELCESYKENDKFKELESSSFTTGGSHGIEHIEWCARVGLHMDNKQNKTFVICKLIQVCATPGSFEEKTVAFHLVKSNGDLLALSNADWCYAFPYKGVVEDRKALLPNGTLTVVCHLSLKYPATLKRFAESEKSSPGPSDFRILYENQLHPDFTLKCGDKEFRAHKCVLATRSSVFRKMFEHDTKEQRENAVQIEDSTPEAIRVMLQFIYCNKTDELTQETRLQLYALADKYDIGELKSLCSKAIANHMRVENACEVALLAHLHHDDELLSATKGFFKWNYPDVVTSPEWTSLTSQYAELAKVLVKK